MGLRDDFPFFKHHPDLAYFDNAATTLKPQSVIDAVTDYYERLSSNIHRGDYETSRETEMKYDATRDKIAKFIGTEAKNIVFTSGASESLNLVAHGYGRHFLKKDDVVLLSAAEHASNTLPWFNLVEELGIKVEFIPLDATGHITMEALKESLHENVRLVSLAHISNILAYVNDIQEMAKLVHANDALFCVDGAQAIGHIPVNVVESDVDFYAFSAHKMLGPSGVGVLYAKEEILEMMKPLNTGGGNNVRYNACGSVTLKKAPAKFESGTPNIEGVIGFGAAIDYLNDYGMENIHTYLQPLHKRAVEGLMAMSHVTVYNPEADNAIIAFSVEGIFAQDVAAYLDRHNIAVRSGEHCAKMLNGVLHAEKSVRLSLYIYNTMEEVEHFLNVMSDISLEKTIDLYI